jgi:hypothetical protein
LLAGLGTIALPGRGFNGFESNPPKSSCPDHRSASSKVSPSWFGIKLFSLVTTGAHFSARRRFPAHAPPTSAAPQSTTMIIMAPLVGCDVLKFVVDSPIISVLTSMKPMSPMTAYSPYLKQIDDLVGKHVLAISAFFHKDRQVPLGIAAAKGFGSGFLIRHPKGVVLSTAEHVARQAIAEKIVFLKIGDAMISLERQQFLFDAKVDVAMSLFTFEQLETEQVKNFTAIEMPSRTDSHLQSGFCAVVGCPSTRNKLDQRFKGKRPRVLSMTLEKANITAFAGTKIPVPLLLHYEPKGMIAGANLPENGAPSDLHGMSGGPIFDVCASAPQQHGKQADINLQFRLAGMSVEWHDADRLVVGTSVDILRGMMQHF